MMMCRLPLSAALVFISCLCAASSRSQPWDHFVFTQQWPWTVCPQSRYDYYKNECTIPKDVTKWTIHGLWPSYKATHGPSCCDPKRLFNVSLIQSLEPQLQTNWPNLFSNTPPASFWKHEWDKHGTCAEEIPETSGEYNYFSYTLHLHQQYDLYSALLNSGIQPSDTKTYQASDILEAFTQSFGEKPYMECAKTEDPSVGNLGQVEICMSKQFTIIKCPPGTHRTRSLERSSNPCKKHGHHDNTLYFSSMMKEESFSAELYPCSKFQQVRIPAERTNKLSKLSKFFADVLG